MDKARLKEVWGSYCDTDSLVNSTMALLTKYNHRNSEYGVCKMLNEFFTNKLPLIELIQKSENYKGDLRVVIDVELEREYNSREIRDFCNNFLARIKAADIILKKVDEHNKTLFDYLRTGMTHISPKDLFKEDIVNKLIATKENISRFDNNGYLYSSWTEYNNLHSFIYYGFGCNPKPTLGESIIRMAEENSIHVKLAEGMKTSRAFNRVCKAYKLDKAHPVKVNTLDPETGEVIETRTTYLYDKLFAEYSDMVSDLKRKLKFFISVNPLDYLTMSFGVNWASCQTIDRQNVRHMPNAYSGQYCGGTLSYMLDGSSFITYVHTNIPESVEEGKIYRNMFHFQNNRLVQGRIYPQGNDGSTDLYKTFRGFVQDELGAMLGLENKTWVKSHESCGNVTSSMGLHYRDYINFGDCNVSYPKEKADDLGYVHIGHNGICAHCGEFINSSGSLSHGICVVPIELTIENEAFLNDIRFDAI